MERDHNIEAKRFSRAFVITTIAFRLTTIFFLAMSLTLLVTNVLRVPYEEDKAVIIHFNDDSGFKFMVYVIAILIGYSALQIFLAILQMKNNRDPSFVCVYYGELFSFIFLLTISIEGFITTRSYQNWLGKWLGDVASMYDGYFVKSYASASMLLLALICKVTSLIVFSCGHNRRTSFYMSSKVNAVVGD